MPYSVRGTVPAFHQNCPVSKWFGIQNLGCKCQNNVTGKNVRGNNVRGNNVRVKTVRGNYVRGKMTEVKMSEVKLSEVIKMSDANIAQEMSGFEKSHAGNNARSKMSGRQLGTFSVNGEWFCGHLFVVSGENPDPVEQNT